MGSVNNSITWLKGVLIPFWVLQLILIILELAFSALGLTALMALQNYRSCSYNYYTEDYECTTYHYDYGVAIGAEGAAVGLSSVFFIMTVAEIIMFCMHSLTPQAYFGIELTKLIIWTIIFIIVMVGIAIGGVTILSVVFTVLMELLFIGSLVYGSVVYHRHRKGRLGQGGAFAAQPATNQQPVAYAQPQHQY